MRFSANLGFLWADLALPDAIIAAKSAGFDAVECHWPYHTPPKDIQAALRKTGLDMLGINTDRGNIESGDNGLSAIPGREHEARTAIDQAIAYAAKIDAKNVHVLAGFSDGEIARTTFIDNLRYACAAALPQNITILIEPLNKFDAPGYFLNTTNQAADIIETANAPNLKLMFDCYHVGRTDGDVLKALNTYVPIIGHIQFASVPDRGTPDHGDIDFAVLFAEIERLGWTTPLGAEYKPIGRTEDSLTWLAGA